MVIQLLRFAPCKTPPVFTSVQRALGHDCAEGQAHLDGQNCYLGQQHWYAVVAHEAAILILKVKSRESE